MMRATGELFKDYEEYLNALLDYQARRWSCAVSGKGKLTYEEAQVAISQVWACAGRMKNTEQNGTSRLSDVRQACSLAHV